MADSQNSNAQEQPIKPVEYALTATPQQALEFVLDTSKRLLSHSIDFDAAAHNLTIALLYLRFSSNSADKNFKLLSQTQKETEWLSTLFALNFKEANVKLIQQKSEILYDDLLKPELS